MKIPEDMVGGTVHSTLLNGDLTVIQYHNARTVEIQFVGYVDTLTVSSNLIRKKKVKNPMKPSVYGIGFIGIGKYSNLEHRKAYVTWNNMLKRCYCIKTQAKHPTYKNCSVSAEWLNFQNFAEWFYENFVENFELDKDLKHQGNKVYNKENCMFIPKTVNRVITDSLAARSEYGIGVTYHSKTKKLAVGCNNGSRKRVHLGYFDVNDLESAQDTYFEYKYKIIKKLAYQQKNETIKQALLDWVIPKN